MKQNGLFWTPHIKTHRGDRLLPERGPMRLRTKLLITYGLFFIPAFFYVTAGYQDELKFRYLEGVEEALVDESRILAGHTP